MQHFTIPPNEALRVDTCYNAQGQEVERRNTNPDYRNSIFRIPRESDPDGGISLNDFLRHHEKFGDAAKDVVFCTGYNYRTSSYYVHDEQGRRANMEIKFSMRVYKGLR